MEANKLGFLYNFIMQRFFVFAVFILAFFLRVVLIDSYPPHLNWDEVSHGYNAFSILTSGQDEWGNSLPTIFRAYGDYKLPVYIYLTVLSEAIFGVNEFAVRLPSALAGAGTVVFSFLLVEKLFKNRRAALTTSFLVAIEPWTLFLSRVAVEANVALFLIVAGTYFFLEGLKNRNVIILSLIMFGLSVWTYNSARIFTPLFVVSLVLVYRKNILKSFRPGVLILPIVVFLVFIAPMFIQLINPLGQARYGWVRILDEGAIAKIEELRNNSPYSPNTTKILYNRPLYFVSQFSSNYISHFSPKFLFIEGGSNYQFNIPGKGILHIVGLPFFYLGILLSVNKARKNKNFRLLIVWMLLAPVASSLTREAPHTLRNIVFLPLPMIFTSLAITKVFGKRLQVAILFIFTILLLFYIRNYISYAGEYSTVWQYGNKQMVEIVKKEYENYDNIIVTKAYGEPHEFILFYWPWESKKFITDENLVRFNQSNWYWVDRFDKFYFVNDWQVPEKGEVFLTESKALLDCEGLRCILFTTKGNRPEGWEKIEEIKFLDGEIAFEVYEN